VNGAAAAPLLDLRGLHKRYGALRVVDDVSLAVSAGETLGIIGPNGAGKTTLFNLIGGDVVADEGHVIFRGEDVTRLRPHARCRRGIGRAYQVALPFGGLTVFENLLAAATFGGKLRRREAERAAVDALLLAELGPKANRLAGSLTLLDRKRLEMARALATNPELLLLDEIAGGLTEHEAHEVVAMVRAIGGRGVAIVWIEHVVHAVLAVATRLFVLSDGRELAQGDPHDVIASDAVRRVYLGLEA